MKRTALVLAALTATLAPLVSAQAAPEVTALEGFVRDARDDGYLFKDNSTASVGRRSGDFDLYKVHGRTSNGILTITLTLDDLTPENTKIFEKSPGWYSFDGNFQTNVFVNGTLKWEVARAFGHAYAHSLTSYTTGVISPWQRDGTTGSYVGCLNADQTDAVNQVFNYTKDTVTYTLPLSCLNVEPGDILRLAGSVGGGTQARYYVDDSAKTTKFTVG